MTDPNAQLREALEPFVAHWQPWMDDDFVHPDWDEMSCFARVTYGDLRRARAALAVPPAPEPGEVERVWPDIGTDPMKGDRPANRMDASEEAIRAAYVRQQPHVPDQTALVWRWHLGALLEAKVRLEAILRDRPALRTPQAKSAAGEVALRVDCKQYPEVVQAARWSDEDNGTNHFMPGVGFVVDDPDGLTIPARWKPHLDMIEQALASLDHSAPHPLDKDTIRVLEESRRPSTIHDSAAYCFVVGEHTPMMAMANSSPELWAAHRFLNEYFEGWEFDPTAGFAALRSNNAGVEEAAIRAAETEACARVAEEFGDKLLVMRHRPGSPPGNYERDLRGSDIAAAIRQRLNPAEVK